MQYVLNTLCSKYDFAEQGSYESYNMLNFYAGSSYFLNDRHKTTFKFNSKIYWLYVIMVRLAYRNS